MSMGAMSYRLLPALGLLALLLVAVIGCGGDEQDDAVVSAESAARASASSPVSEDAPSLPPAAAVAASESFPALPPGSRGFFSAGPAEESAATAPTLPEAPCTSDSATCEPRDVGSFDLFSGSGGQAAGYPVDGTASVKEVLQQGLRSAGASPVHIAVRGTASADSVRCDWRGIARTPAQRALAIRYRLGLEEDEAIPSTAYLELLFTAVLDVYAPKYLETAKSNFLAIARRLKYTYVGRHDTYT